MEIESKTVSLVIGTYNPRLDWLENALKSSEGLFDEIIIVDDHSSQPVPNSSVRHDVNKGFYEARNTGCHTAQSDWIASLDDDDEFIPQNVKLLREFINTTDADIVYFPCELFGDSSGIWGNKADLNQILDANQIPSGSWFKKSTWERLNGFQYPVAEDWDFWARARKHKMKFAYFELPIYRHRIRDGSLSANWKGDTYLSIRKEIRQRYENEKIHDNL
jgi:glycosyltransferase involved in cell wall biosynthesis